MSARRIRLLAVGIVFVAALALLPGADHGLRAQAPPAKTYNFNAYFAVGDSLAAGYESGSLVETHQVNSVPAHLARQANAADFQQPLVSEPGIPPERTLLQLTPAIQIVPKSNTPGVPKNLGLTRPYNNLAVPGANALTALTRAGGDVYHDLILRGRGSQVAQAAASGPTVVTLWIGNNDVLGAAVAGRAIEGVTLTPSATFRQLYQQIVDMLVPTRATIVAANLPDVTTIPYVTTIPPYVANPATRQPVLVNGQRVPLIGPNGPLPSGSFVTLAASEALARGDGVPTAFGGRGTALPDEFILDPAEVAFIRDHVSADNQAIREICQAASIPVVDLFTLLKTTAEGGISVGGVTLTSAYLTGGIFSYDGIHPTDLGYALTANEWIRAINATGGQLPLVDLGPYMGVGAVRSSGVRSGVSATGERAAVSFPLDLYRDLLTLFPRVDGR